MARWIYIFLLFPWVAFGQGAAEGFSTAVQLGENGKYREGIEMLRALQEDGVHSPALEYNLGTMYLHLDSIGKSLVHLERALKYKPNDRQIRKNIEIARMHIEEPVIPVTPFFLAEWLRKVNGGISLGGWTILAVSFLWILTAGLVLKLRNKQVAGIPVRSWLLILGTAFMVFFFTMAVVAHQRIHKHDTAILMAAQTELKVGPDELSTAYGNIYEGEKVCILNQIDDWLFVELLNRDTGWIRKETVVRI